MKHLCKRMLSVGLCALLLCAALPFTANAETYGGKCGVDDCLRWSFNTVRGVLTISGNGPMEDYEGEHDAPWTNYKMDISGVKVESGVTYVGSLAFVKLHCTYITMADSVQSVGSGAIQTCLYLKDVTFSDGVRSIGRNNVTGCEKLETVHVSRFTQTIGSGFMRNSRNAAVICSTSADCAAKAYAEENGINFKPCSHAEHTHNYTTIEATATCTQGGFTKYECTVCGDSYTDDETAALGHAFGEWSVTTDPTCTAAGEKSRICSRCEITETQPVDATGHSYNAVVTEPTCTEKGFTTHTCTACGDSYTDEETDAAGHAYDAVVTAPTCTAKGFTTHTCTVCGDTVVDTYVSALAHDWREASRTAATCTANGTVVFICARDASHTRTEVLPASGHDYTAVVTAPTCTADGYTTHTCSTCGESFRDTVVPAAGHRYDVQVVAPECLTGGYRIYTCSVCGEQHTGSPMPALGHTYADGVCIRCGKGECWDYTAGSSSVTLTAYTGNDSILTVPASLGGKRVTAIADGAAAGNTQIEFVCVPDSVRSVGADAFSGCSSLREVFLGGGLTAVGDHAFAQCGSLAVVCVTAEHVDLRNNVFGGCDSRFCCIAPAGSQTAAFLDASALRHSTFTYPAQRDGKPVIAFSGETVLYGDIEYYYWVQLARRYPDAVYLRFDRLVFDGVSPSLLQGDFSDAFVDSSAKDLTLKNVYVSVQVQDETITFDRLVQLLENGQISLAVSFDAEGGEKLTIFQKIGGAMHKVFNALTKLINSIIRIFKKK